MPNDMLKSAEFSKNIPSSATNFKFFKKKLSEAEIVDILSDLKHRIFPRPFERLSKIHNKKGLIGVEIGVYGGEHALSMLEHLDVERLYCIDPYELYDDYTAYVKRIGVDIAPLSAAEMRAKELLKDHRDKLTWIKKMSADAVSDIAGEVDFVYIDGNHLESYVKSDLENYLKVLKKGGVIGGHDFYNGFQRQHDGVIDAVTKFIANTEYKLQVELPDWWIET